MTNINPHSEVSSFKPESTCRQICAWINSLAAGEARGQPVFENPYANRIVEAIASYHQELQKRDRQRYLLDNFLSRLHEGRHVNELIDFLFEHFGEYLPFDRIGLSFLEEDEPDVAVAVYMRLREGTPKLPVGYRAHITHSSLQHVLNEGQPRIISDLEEYLREHPDSVSTRLIVQEGMRSSLTVPLQAFGRAVGFLFFSSRERATYNDSHAALLLRISRKLGLAIEKTRMMEALRLRNEQVRRLSNMASHDLRNPISVIQGYVELLEAQAAALPPDANEALKKMRFACAQAHAILADIMDLALIDSQSIRLRKSETALANLLQEHLATQSVRLASKGLQIEFNPAGSLPLVYVDQQRIGRVFDNLLSNAIKVSPVGATIHVTLELSGSYLRVSVRDHGPGISAQDQHRLFNCFASLDDSAAEHNPTSIGLGLAAAKELVLAHEGHIGVESSLGNGATFWFEVPIGAPASAA